MRHAGDWSIKSVLVGAARLITYVLPAKEGGRERCRRGRGDGFVLRLARELSGQVVKLN